MMEEKISFKRKYLPSLYNYETNKHKNTLLSYKSFVIQVLKIQRRKFHCNVQFLKRKKIPLIKNQYLYTFESLKFQYCYVILPFFSDMYLVRSLFFFFEMYYFIFKHSY